jgi:hypothetical protein
VVNVYDQAARYAVKIDPGGFCRWLLPGLDSAIGFREWLDTRTLPSPGQHDRTCDTVAALAREDAPDAEWALVIEHQAEPDPDMLDRLLEYLARLRRELRHGPERRGKYQVIAAVLNLTGPAQPDLLEMALPGLVRPGLAFSAVVKTLRQEDAAAALDGIAKGRVARCILSWISLMLGGEGRDTIERWKALAAAEPDRRLRADYGALALTFAALAGRKVQWKQELEGWNMLESSVVDEWKAEGEAKGMAKAKREDLMRVLHFRFPALVPTELEAVIQAQTDLETLSHWFEAALRATSLEEFRGVVPR